MIAKCLSTARFFSAMLCQNWRFLRVILVCVVCAFVADANPTRNCSADTLPSTRPGAELKWRPNGRFEPGEVAVFVCTEHYRQIGWLPRFSCESDGNWSSNSTAEGYCQLNTCNMTINNTRQTFHCADGNKIDLCRKCDCILDCADGSDEAACGAILQNVTGKQKGIVEIWNEDPRRYNLTLNCSQTFWTDDAGRSILLNFDTFDLLAECEDYVYLIDAVFVDPVRDVKCDASIPGVPCTFCDRVSPPLARSRENWLTITWHISNETAQRSKMSATWYNVIDAFPSGLLPEEEETFPPFLVKPTPASLPKVADEDDGALITASILFGCLLAVVLLTLAIYVAKTVIFPRNPRLASWFRGKAAAVRILGARRESAPSSDSNGSAEERTPLRRGLSVVET